MLISKTVTIKWNNKNKKHYENKGYVFTHLKDEFIIDIKDITPSSKAIVEVSCDYCGKIIRKKYQTYISQHDKKFGDCCQQCTPKKNKEVCMDKYGVTNGSKTEDSKIKRVQTSLERYGVENPSQTTEARTKISKKSKLNSKQSQEKAIVTNRIRYGTDWGLQNDHVKSKIKHTMLEKYGVEHPKQSDEIKKKEKQHILEKYGVEYYFQSEDCKEKSKITCMEKYGVEYSLQSEYVREKINDSFLKNGSCKTSSQQLKVYEMLKKHYGKCELNKPCGACMLDCALFVNDVWIDVEYDGRYWHQDKLRDRRRDEFVKSQGYKILRIRGDYKVPTMEELKNKIQKLITSDKKFEIIEMV